MDVVPYHDRSPGGHTEIGQRGDEEGRRRLADHGDPGFGGGFEPDDEGPHVQRRAVGRLVADIAMEGDDRDAAQGQPEGRVEFLVTDAGSGPAEEHYPGGAGVDDLDPFEVLAQISLVDDETAEAGMGVGQVTGRARDCGEDVAFVDLHPGPSQQRGDLTPRPRRRVGHEAKGHTLSREPPDRLDRSAQRLPGHGEHAVDIE